MNNPIELRGSQIMISEIVKHKFKFTTLLKWLVLISALVFLIKFPEVTGHSIMWVIHTFYEATSFVLEHFLMHTFHFDKDLAQLVVFYFSIFTGVGITFLFWQYYLKDYLLYKFYTYKYQIIFYWHSKRTVDKAKVILVHSVLLISTFMFLIS